MLKIKNICKIKKVRNSNKIKDKFIQKCKLNEELMVNFKKKKNNNNNNNNRAIIKKI